MLREADDKVYAAGCQLPMPSKTCTKSGGLRSAMMRAVYDATPEACYGRAHALGGDLPRAAARSGVRCARKAEQSAPFGCRTLTVGVS